MLALKGCVVIDEVSIQKRTERKHGETQMAVPVFYMCVHPSCKLLLIGTLLGFKRQSLNATS